LMHSSLANLCQPLIIFPSNRTPLILSALPISSC
jgi:hypothetical protein